MKSKSYCKCILGCSASMDLSQTKTINIIGAKEQAIHIKQRRTEIKTQPCSLDITACDVLDYRLKRPQHLIQTEQSEINQDILQTSYEKAFVSDIVI